MNVETVMVNIGFVAMTAASMMLMAPESGHGAHGKGQDHAESYGAVHVVAHDSSHERMEEIRHDPASYGILMRSPATAGSA